MKIFKDFVVEDNNEVFFNTNEFAEIHKVADNDCKIVFTNQNKAKADSKISDDYNNTNSFSFLVKKEEIGFKPVVDNMIQFDTQTYTVVDVLENMFTYEVFLEANLR